MGFILSMEFLLVRAVWAEHYIEPRPSCSKRWFLPRVGDFVVGFDHGLPWRVKTWPSGLSYDKNLGLRPRFLFTESLGPCFYTAWETMTKSYYSTLTDWLFSFCSHNFSALKWAIVAHIVVAMGIALLLWTGCQGTQMNNCHENLNI